MMRPTYLRSLVALASLTILFATPAARAAVFTVDSTADAPDAIPGDGFCDTGGGVCTLRAAIEEINALPLDFVYLEDFEAGTGGWTSSGINDTWSRRTAWCDGTPLFSNQFVSDRNWGPTCTSGSSLEQSRILGPPIALPAGSEPLDLEFEYESNEDGSCTTSASGTDRKSVGITTDGGASVTILNDCFPLEFRNVFELGAFAGQTVQVVFDYDTVDDVGSGRVSVDDIRITRRPRIEFNLLLPATIQLTLAQLEIERPFELVGPGRDNLTILGGAAAAVNPDICARVLSVETSSSDDIITISGLTISNGLVEPDCKNASGSFDDRGGGGLFLNNGDLTLSDCAFTFNLADGTDGGGAIVASDDLTIDDCIIDSNRADGSDGGEGLLQDFIRLTVRNSTITNNSADNAGDSGGLYFQSSGGVFVNTTISGNRALNAESGGGEGGGVWLGNGGSLDVMNTIIAGNFSDGADNGPSSDCADDDDELITLGFNIFGVATGCDIGAFELAPATFGIVFSTIYEEFARGLYLHDHNAYQTPDEQGPITLFAGDFVPIPLGLDAVDVQANGDLLFSTDHSGFAYHSGGWTYIRESNVYRLDGAGAIFTEVDFARLWIGVQGLDALDKIGASTYAFSTKRSQHVFHACGFLYLNHANVYVVDTLTRTVTLLYDLRSIRLRDLDGLDVLPDGRLAFSTATGQMLWTPFPSLNARQEDIYIYDPADDSVTLFFDGSVAQIDTLDALSIDIGTE